MSPTLASYISVTFFLVVTPGATTAVVIQNALRGGFRRGIQAAVGAAAGNSTVGVATGLGLLAILQRWPEVIEILRIAGGLYLVWLGARALWRIWSPKERAEEQPTDSDSGLSPIRQGWMITALNPSILTFYAAILPSFLAPGAGYQEFAVLAAIHVSMAFACHCVWAFATDMLSHPYALYLLDKFVAVALIALGVKMILPLS